MKFNVNSTIFLNAVSPVIGVATKSIDKTCDTANKLSISVEDKGITVKAFSGRVASSLFLSDTTIDDLAFSFDTEGCVTVDAASLVETLVSFVSNDDVIFELKTVEKSSRKELVISKKSDLEQFQVLPCFDKQISLPKITGEAVKTLKISRELYLYGIEKVSFSLGFEKSKERYLYWVLRTDEDKVRFVSGTGALFSCLDLSGDKILDSSPKKTNYLFHKDHTFVISKALSMRKDDEIKIEEFRPSNDESFAISITSGCLKLIMLGMNPNIKFPEENKIFGKEHDYKVVTRVEDWREIGLSVAATISDSEKKERRIHIAALSFDKAKKVINVNTQKMRSKRKVKMLDISEVEQEDLPKLTFVSNYIDCISRAAPEVGNLQMEFSTQDSPMIIRYHAQEKIAPAAELTNTNVATGITESFSALFVTQKEV